MKVLSAKQIRAADAYTIENEPISSLALMERASLAFVECFCRHYGKSHSIQVICGAGNNGGDGVVIGRLLKQRGYQVNTSVILTDAPGEDLMSQIQKTKNEIHQVHLGEVVEIAPVVIIDALFGSGLNRPLEGQWTTYVREINERARHIVSVDLPSGLMADDMTPGDAIVQADLTITLNAPKLSFFIPETGGYVGDWEAVDIGLHQDFIKHEPCLHFVTGSEIMGRAPRRGKFQHKGDFGRVQNIAGSFGKMGAAVLSSKAIMRSGAGLLTTHVPACGVEIMQTAIPEAMVTADQQTNFVATAQIDNETDVICVGPGLGTHKGTAEWLLHILEEAVGISMVMDADALNIVAARQGKWLKLPEGCIITPHVGEFHRLFGEHDNGFERLKTAQKAAKEKHMVVVLKGAHTAIIAPDGVVHFNTTGNPGMATAGSGDVLAGMITGWWAQGLSSVDAARVAVFLHGQLGDQAARKLGEYALMASDLLD